MLTTYLGTNVRVLTNIFTYMFDRFTVSSRSESSRVRTGGLRATEDGTGAGPRWPSFHPCGCLLPAEGCGVGRSWAAWLYRDQGPRLTHASACCGSSKPFPCWEEVSLSFPLGPALRQCPGCVPLRVQGHGAPSSFWGAIGNKWYNSGPSLGKEESSLAGEYSSVLLRRVLGDESLILSKGDISTAV